MVPARLLRHAALIVLLIDAPALPASEEGPLGLADLPAYQAALSGRSDHDKVPVPVEFRDLWDHPKQFEGRRVEVAGAIVRRFRQGAYGVFPPLEELWVVSRAGNPLCFVYPARDAPASKLGDTVRFVGTYLKRVQYQVGDVARLAPLIVGDRAPSVIKAAEVPPVRSTGGLSSLDWTVGLVVTGLVVLILGRQHLRRPPRPALDGERPGPPPDFIGPRFEENGSAV